MSVGWITVNKKWKDKTETEGPSLRLWWIVINDKLKKRWIVKNLKAFCTKNFKLKYPSTPASWQEKSFYEELSRWGYAYPNWKAEKPRKHIHVYNLLGTTDLKKYKGAFEKEIPFNYKEYNIVRTTGMLSEVKQFWNDVDFTI